MVGVVGNEHKHRIPIPRLLACRLKEFTQRHIGVAHALVDRLSALVLEGGGVLLRHLERVVRRSREHRSHKRLLEAVHHSHHMLQIGFVPHCPHAIEVGIATAFGVGIVFGATEVFIVACGARKRLKAHRTVLRAVEKCAVIALVVEHTGKACEVVHRRWREEKRLHHHRNARQRGGHGVDTLAAVGKGVFKREAMGEQGIDKRSVATVFSTVQITVQTTYILTPKTLHYQHHHIFLVHHRA